MSTDFDNERTDKEMAERFGAGLTWNQMDEAQRAEFDKGEAEYSGNFPTVADYKEAADRGMAKHATPEEQEAYASKAEQRRHMNAQAAKRHQTYKANVIKNAKYSWEAAQARADQLERIYEDLLKQGRIGR